MILQIVFIKKSSLASLNVLHTEEITLNSGEVWYIVIGSIGYLLIILLTIFYIRKKTLNSAILKYNKLWDNVGNKNEGYNCGNGVFDESIKLFQECGVIFNRKVQTDRASVLLLHDVITTISEKYTDPEFDVNKIIAKAGMSRSVFYKKFQALSNQSLNNILKNYRLNKAAELLTSGRHTVSQAAYDCGFSDPAYFSKVFKERFKTPPRSFLLNRDDQNKPVIPYN